MAKEDSVSLVGSRSWVELVADSVEAPEISSAASGPNRRGDAQVPSRDLVPYNSPTPTCPDGAVATEAPTPGVGALESERPHACDMEAVVGAASDVPR